MQGFMFSVSQQAQLLEAARSTRLSRGYQLSQFDNLLSNYRRRRDANLFHSAAVKYWHHCRPIVTRRPSATLFRRRFIGAYPPRWCTVRRPPALYRAPVDDVRPHMTSRFDSRSARHDANASRRSLRTRTEGFRSVILIASSRVASISVT